MKKKIFATALVALAALAAGGPAAGVEPAGRAAGSDEDFHLVVDLSERTLSVVENGDVTQSYPVAVGKPQHPTPRGEFRVRRIVWNPRWAPPDASWAREKRPRDPGDPRNPMGRVKIFFRQPDYYIHGTRETDSLGQAESHGCVRMRNSEVVSLARRVMANGGAPRSAGWFQRVINRVRSTQDVRLSDPVLVRIRA